MAQLVELQKRSDEFSKLDTELIFVFREEMEGVEGLKKILQKHKTTFYLGLDLDKKSSKAYSNKKMTFDNFVIDKSGVVRNVIDGTLKVRATSEQLISTLQSIERRTTESK